MRRSAARQLTRSVSLANAPSTVREVAMFVATRKSTPPMVHAM